MRSHEAQALHRDMQKFAAIASRFEADGVYKVCQDWIDRITGKLTNPAEQSAAFEEMFKQVLAFSGREATVVLREFITPAVRSMGSKAEQDSVLRKLEDAFLRAP